MKSLLFQTKSIALLLAISALFFPSTVVLAQKRFAKTYPTSRSIRLQLINRSGTITVSGWERNEIRVTALMEAPAAKVIPESNGESLTINVVRDNYGRADVGSVNFEIKVPVGSNVDIETKMGNLTVRDVSGEMVRANVTSEGDITLSNIKASSVMAANVIGDIFFDGEFHEGGTYRFSTTRGNINMHVPFSSSFRMVATAPSTRNISLGSFVNSGLNFISQGQRVIGNVGGGNASLTVSSQRGSISFVKN